METHVARGKDKTLPVRTIKGRSDDDIEMKINGQQKSRENQKQGEKDRSTIFIYSPNSVKMKQQ